MGATHGKHGILYKWNGTGSDLSGEACTEDAATAQITDTAKRILNPNATVTFTDTGGEAVTRIDYAEGKAYFSGNVTVVTCSGTGAYVASGNLVKTGYLYEWALEFTLETHDLTAFQDDWRAMGGGLAAAAGSAQGFMVGSNWWDDLEDETDGTKDLWFLELFSYDPDDDRTGDHYDLWAVITGLNPNVPLGDYIKETINFEAYGYVPFTANS